MYASLLLGNSSHKEVTNPLLRFYYWKVTACQGRIRERPSSACSHAARCLCTQPVLFLVCAATELWYMSLYVLAHIEGPLIGGVPAVRGLLYVCTPVCAFKQVANVVQMAVACEALVEHDKGKKK